MSFQLHFQPNWVGGGPKREKENFCFGYSLHPTRFRAFPKKLVNNWKTSFQFHFQPNQARTSQKEKKFFFFFFVLGTIFPKPELEHSQKKFKKKIVNKFKKIKKVILASFLAKLSQVRSKKGKTKFSLWVPFLLDPGWSITKTIKK